MWGFVCHITRVEKVAAKKKKGFWMTNTNQILTNKSTINQ